MCWNAPSSSWPAMPGWCTWLDPTRVTASCGSAPRGLSLDRVATRLRIGSPVSGLAVPQRRPVAFVDLAQIMAGELDASADPIVDDLGSHLVVRRIGNLLSEPSAADSLKRLPLTHPAILAVPLIARHEIYGALSLFHGAPRQFSEQDVDLASAFANQAALVFENASLRDAGERRLVEVEALAADNARLHQQSEQRAGELEALYRADAQIYRSLRLDEVLNSLVEVATDILRPDKVAVGILDERGERIVVGAARGFSATTVAESVPLADTLTLRANPGQGVVVVEDARIDPGLPGSLRAVVEREGIRSSMTAPIRIGDELIGAFGLGYCEPRAFGEGEQRLLVALAQRAGLAIQNARLFERAQHAAVLEERQRLAGELAEELRASRQRIVAAQDAERRRLERDIHDGAQQQRLRSRSTFASPRNWSGS
jgi:GAF domain-containing protein